MAFSTENEFITLRPKITTEQVIKSGLAAKTIQLSPSISQTIILQSDVLYTAAVKSKLTSIIHLKSTLK
jgi:hypothetical protein